MKYFGRVLAFLLCVALIISSFCVIFSCKPIMHEIGLLSYDNHIVYAFLWLIVLMFSWAVGVSMFFIGTLLAKYIIDEFKDDKKKKEE